jgi:predicted nucleic acid-binding Zn ribbon protein
VSGEAGQSRAEVAALDRLRASSAKPRQPRAEVAEWSSARDPQAVGDLVEEFIGAEGWDQEVSVATLIARWPQIVGPDIAEHCRPEDYADGELSVRTDSSAWATQIRLLTPQMISRIQGVIGAGIVTDLVVRGPAGPRRPPGRWSVKPSPS